MSVTTASVRIEMFWTSEGCMSFMFNILESFWPYDTLSAAPQFVCTLYFVSDDAMKLYDLELFNDVIYISVMVPTESFINC
jgi:hypothetical protein